MRYVALAEVVELHRRLLEATGGATGVRDLAALEAAVAQPKTFLVLNGAEVDAELEEQEQLMLELASGSIDRHQLADWLRRHLKPIT